MSTALTAGVGSLLSGNKALSTLTGFGAAGSSQLEKAKIYVADTDYHFVAKGGKEIIDVGDEKDLGAYLECQFNPASITIKKSVVWELSGIFEDDEPGDDAVPGLNAPDLEFKGGGAATYDLELFFDTTQEDPAESDKRDVRRYTNDLLELTLGDYDEENEVAQDPRSVMFVWGELILFNAVVSSVEISYIMFDPNGIPTRAKAKVEFIQRDVFGYDTNYTAPTNPTSRTQPKKTWLVRQGQSLHQIAYAEYGHSGHWRHIADSNNILNPLKIEPGQILVLPPLP